MRLKRFYAPVTALSLLGHDATMTTTSGFHLPPPSSSVVVRSLTNSKKGVIAMRLSREETESIVEMPSSRRHFVTSVGLLTGSVMLGRPSVSNAAYNPRVGGLTNKIRSICQVMDELQRDLMQERWDLVSSYPLKLRSYVPIFTTYTDTAFPTDEPTDKALRVALRYEVGRFYASVERFRQATSRESLDEAYVAYSDMALHFDRYLHTGNLYMYEDPLISTETFYQGVSDKDLIYSDPVKDPPEVRDLIVLVKGPDKGKTGIVIGIYRDGSNNCVVKLDKYRSKYGIREIRVVPTLWAAKRLGEQDPDEVFLIPRDKNVNPTFQKKKQA